jgi:hypothetical protein
MPDDRIVCRRLMRLDVSALMGGSNNRFRACCSQWHASFRNFCDLVLMI